MSGYERGRLKFCRFPKQAVLVLVSSLVVATHTQMLPIVRPCMCWLRNGHDKNVVDPLVKGRRNSEQIQLESTSSPNKKDKLTSNLGSPVFAMKPDKVSSNQQPRWHFQRLLMFSVSHHIFQTKTWTLTHTDLDEGCHDPLTLAWILRRNCSLHGSWSDVKFAIFLDCLVQEAKNFSSRSSLNLLICEFVIAVFRWFEELGPICELLEKASKIGVSEIKSPMGRVFQKYVYTCFIVKMRINFGSFGLFWFNLGWG